MGVEKTLPNSNKRLLDFLGRLETLLNQSLGIYKAYLENGKTFSYACALKESNEQIRSEIRNNSALLPDEQKQNAQALLDHLNVWCDLWNKTSGTKRFSPGDIFVFNNSPTFPRKEVDNIMMLYNLTKN